jgi:hypothetical protein
MNTETSATTGLKQQPSLDAYKQTKTYREKLTEAERTSVDALIVECPNLAVLLCVQDKLSHEFDTEDKLSGVFMSAKLVTGTRDDGTKKFGGNCMKLGRNDNVAHGLIMAAQAQSELVQIYLHVLENLMSGGRNTITPDAEGGFPDIKLTQRING